MPQLLWQCEICGFGYQDKTTAAACEMRHVNTKRWTVARIVDMRYESEHSIWPTFLTIRYTEDARDDRIYAITNHYPNRFTVNGHNGHENSTPHRNGNGKPLINRLHRQSTSTGQHKGQRRNDAPAPGGTIQNG